MILVPESILVIRRDNIGDLACTTPVFAALRRRFPDAWIGALVNDYGRPVLDGNADIDEVFSYRKAKHRSSGESLLRIYWERWQMLRQLRKRGLDCVVLASPGYQESAERLAKWVRPRHILGFDHGSGVPDMKVPVHAGNGMHQVMNTFRVLEPLGIHGPPPSPRVVPDAQKAADCQARLAGIAKPVIGVHISAREADRRWPDACFQSLIKALTTLKGASVLLTWAPGGADRSEFPGDDASAAGLCRELPGETVLPWRTESLTDLIAGLSVCDIVICSDGGPVHLAAALGKPVIALFGSERPELWHPWNVPYRLIQKPSRTVSDIAVGEVLQAYCELKAAVLKPS